MIQVLLDLIPNTHCHTELSLCPCCLPLFLPGQPLTAEVPSTVFSVGSLLTGSKQSSQRQVGALPRWPSLAGNRRFLSIPWAQAGLPGPAPVALLLISTGSKQQLAERPRAKPASVCVLEPRLAAFIVPRAHRDVGGTLCSEWTPVWPAWWQARGRVREKRQACSHTGRLLGTDLQL